MPSARAIERKRSAALEAPHDLETVDLPHAASKSRASAATLVAACASRPKRGASTV
jgi:hypothetical protein